MTRARDLAAFVSNADGDIKFDTDTLFIDSSANRVGIGETTVDSLLHLSNSDATAYSDTATDGQVGVGPTIYLENPANANTTVGGQIVFGMRSTEAQARIAATGGTAPAITFGTNDAERMRIDSSGRLFINQTSNISSLSLQSTAPSGFSIGSGFYSGSTQSTIEFKDSNTTANYKVRLGSQTDDLVMFAGGSERLRLLAAGGLTFNGDTAAANALNDYEEGTWTAQVSVGGSNVTTTNTDSTYVKIGRQVFLHGNIAFSVGTGTGDVNITGLPYSPAFSGYFRGIMANDFFDESGEFYTIVSTTGPKILPRVGPTGQSDGSRTLNGNDIKDNISARIYIGLIYQV